MKKRQLPFGVGVSFVAGACTDEMVEVAIRKAAQPKADPFARALAQALHGNPVAKRVQAEIDAARREAFVVAERRREEERKRRAAEDAEKAKKEADARRKRLDFPILVDTVGAHEELLQTLFGAWTRNHRCFDEMYDSIEVPKRHGGIRQISAPESLLKTIQRALLDNLLGKAPLHPCCHGFRPGRSTATNAGPHVGHEIVINLDLRDFFPTITSKRVAGLFNQLDVPGGSVARRFLVDLVTLNGRLPQGAPTSPVIANLVARRLDSRLAGLATKASATYTRYADDLTFSGPASILSTLPLIRQIVEEEGFAVAEAKTRVLRRGVRQDVTGLTVNAQVSVPRAIRRRLRAAVHATRHGRRLHWKGEEMALPKLRGHIAYLHSVHPDEAARLRDQLPDAS